MIFTLVAIGAAPALRAYPQVRPGHETPPDVHGDFYVLVDECHPTQSRDLNQQMKKWLPGAIFIGFTGTPLLRADAKSTRAVFGTNIHTYKFPEAVEDGVVLDLKYEARTVPQALSSPEKVDEWFALKTRALRTTRRHFCGSVGARWSAS